MLRVTYLVQLKAYSCAECGEPISADDAWWIGDEPFCSRCYRGIKGD